MPDTLCIAELADGRRHGDAVLADTCRLQAARSIHDHLTGACAARALQALGEVEP